MDAGNALLLGYFPLGCLAIAALAFGLTDRTWGVRLMGCLGFALVFFGAWTLLRVGYADGVQCGTGSGAFGWGPSPGGYAPCREAQLTNFWISFWAGAFSVPLCVATVVRGVLRGRRPARQAGEQSVGAQA